MSELKNITIAVGKSQDKMLPLVQDYDDYIAEYNIETSDTDFFDTMPKVQHVVKITNPNTKKKGEVVIEGIDNFF